MQRGMSAQFPNGRSFNSDFFRRAQAYKDRYGSGANTQIDLYYLFDSTFMHEVGAFTLFRPKVESCCVYLGLTMRS